jgi:hypothetical protein
MSQLLKQPEMEQRTMIPFEPQGRTDRLDTILQAVEQSQQTGIFNVQRGKGGVSEKGSITFLFGQAVDAKVGERSGIEALNWLKTWNSCQYVFTSQAPNEISVPPPAPTPAPTHKITSPLAFVAQMLPRSASHETVKSDTNKSIPEKTPDRLVEHSPARPAEFSPAQAVEQLPFEPVEPVQAPTLPPARPSSLPHTPPSLPSFPAPAYTPAGYNPPNYNTIPQSSSPSYNPVTPVPQTYLAPTHQPTARIPFRLLQGPEALGYIQRAGLSRLHRHIFFLLDGQRSADDLARLTGHQLIDILRLLADLERIGLIRQE